MKITVVGSINMDMVMQVERLPKKGETLTAEEYLTVPGGKGANQAVAARRLGADVAFVGAVGQDGFGETLLRKFSQEGIEHQGIQQCHGPTGNALITVDRQGDNTILVYPGANAQVTPEWVRQQEELIKTADWVMLQLEIPIESVLETAKLAKKNGCQVLLNPAPAKPLPEELLPLVDMVTPNETELVLLSGKKGIEEGAAALLEKGIKTVVVTLGAEGSTAFTQMGSMKAAPFQVKAIDTTAAGDTFNAALVVGLGRQMNLEDALAYANAAGALATTKMGAQSSLPTLEEVEAFMEKQKQQVSQSLEIC